MTAGPLVSIRAMAATDWPAVRDIYERGIATGHATFETSAPSWESWDAAHLTAHRLVAVIDGDVVGWTAMSPVSDRCVYAGVAEHSVYVHPTRRGQGVGRALLDALIASTEAAGMWTIQTGIFPENTASVELHRRCGSVVVGRREKIGQLNGVWRDTLFLERRTSLI
jgi:phosphinothricin acetyltransferase